MNKILTAEAIIASARIRAKAFAELTQSDPLHAAHFQIGYISEWMLCRLAQLSDYELIKLCATEQIAPVDACEPFSPIGAAVIARSSNADHGSISGKNGTPMGESNHRTNKKPIQ